MKHQEAAFPVRVASQTIVAQAPAVQIAVLKDWAYVSFIPPSGNGNLYVSFNVPVNATTGPAIKLVGGAPYSWLLPPDTMIFCASDGPANTTLRIDLLITPSPLQERMLASWKVLTRSVIDVLMAKLLGPDLYTKLKEVQEKPTRSTENRPRTGIYDGMIESGGRP